MNVFCKVNLIYGKLVVKISINNNIYRKYTKCLKDFNLFVKINWF